ncbi:hypothetical protein OESDEN_21962, partial [Oesophagostomum dentatum]
QPIQEFQKLLLEFTFQNEQGVAVPIFVNTSDRVESIWMEAATTRAIHRGSLKGKAFYHNGKRLKSNDIIGDVGIADHDTVRLVVRKLQPFIRVKTIRN